MKKYRVSIKELRKLFPTRIDFKPTIKNKVLKKYFVYSPNCREFYLEQYMRLPAITLLAPFLFLVNIVWHGLSCAPTLVGELLGGFKRLRADSISAVEYEKLINKRK